MERIGRSTNKYTGIAQRSGFVSSANHRESVESLSARRRALLIIRKQIPARYIPIQFSIHHDHNVCPLKIPSKTKEDIKPSFGRDLHLGINKNHDNIVNRAYPQDKRNQAKSRMKNKNNISRAPSPALLRVPLSWVLYL